MAADAGNAVLVVIIEQAIKPVFDAIGRHLGYLFCYKNNIKNLAKTAAQLENSRIDVENFFEEQRRNNEEPARSSVGWLGEVKTMMEDANQIKEDTYKLKGCLNLKGRYVMSRKSTKLAAGIQKLNREAPQGITASTVLPAGSRPGASANEASKGYKTRMQTLNEVMVALEDPANRFIGLCGMGGVGKTKMVHEVREKVRNQKLFDETAMSTVSQNTDMFKIQGDLAEMLGLNALKEVKNVIERADQLRLRLTGGKKVLIILDDVWSNINLEEVGIPVGGEHKQCKVLMTSRQENVCRDIQKNIKVHALDNEEGRNLFRKTVEEHVEKNNLREIADKVADECKGLPIALLTLSSALSNKGRGTWEDALTQLRGGQITGITGMEKEVYQSIKLSYDFLAMEKKEAQPLLLLCCQHQEDAEIYLETLALYCLSLDLFRGVTGLVQARNRVYSLVEHLKSCFLLQVVADGDEDIERVKVHDVVRDVCRSIASEERDRVCMHIWNQEDDAGIGGTDLDYQKLKLLVEVPLHLTDHLPGIKSFLEQTQELRVFESAQHNWWLDRMDEQSAELSLAPQFSTSLRMLSLEHTNVYPGVMSEFIRLTGLEVLSFMGSTLLSFPHQIGQLSNLKLLDLRYEYSSMTSMMPMPSGILPKLKKLEVLLMGIHHFPEAPYSDGEGEGEVDKESWPGRIEELDSLTNLTTLQVDLLDPMKLLDLKCFRFKKLEGFSFGYVGNWSSLDYENKYALHMKNIRLKEVRMNWILGDKIQSMVRSTVDLSLEDIKDWTDTLIFKQFASLKKLELRGCHQLEHIIHDGSSAAFVNLETLKIKKMRKVRELCHNGHLPVGLLHKLHLLDIRDLPEMTHLWMDHTDPLCLVNLKVVKILECGALKFIFPHPAAKCLSQLQKLFVRACGMLEGIVSKAGEGSSTGRVGEIIQESNDLLVLFPKLTKVKIVGSLNLRGFYNLDDGRGQSLFNPKVMLPSIQYLEVDENDSIKAVFDFEGLEAMTMREDERLWLCELREIILCKLPKLEHLCRQVPKDVPIFQNLGTLDVRDCHHLAYLLPSSLARMLVNLQILDVTRCNGMKVVFDFEGLEAMTMREDERLLLCELRGIDLQRLPKLEHLCRQVPKGVPIFQNLGKLRVYGCHSLAYLIPSSIARMLVNLQELQVWNCNGMKEVISKMNEEEEEGCGELEKNIVFPSLTKVTLVNLEKLSSFCSSDQQVFEFPSLEELWIIRCQEIETFCCQIPRVAPSRMLEENVNKGEASTAAGGGGGGETDIHCNLTVTYSPNFRGVPLFQNLGKLTVYGCHSLAYLIPSSIARMLVNLQELTVVDCNSMKKVISKTNEEEEEDCGELEKNIVFPSLTEVILKKLDNLSSFCSSDQQVFEFPSLEKLEISNCPEMETFCCQIPRVAPSRMLEENVNKGEASTVAGGGGGEIDIHCNQAEIEMDPSDLAALFPKLKKVRIQNTPNFRGFYNIERYQVLVNLCRQVPKDVPIFQNLGELIVEGCHSLAYLIPCSIARMLVNLQELYVEDCKGMKEVISKTNEEEEEDCGELEKNIVFRSLTEVILKKLDNLSSFCSSDQQVFEFPSLEVLEISNCPEMETFCCQIPRVAPSRMLEENVNKGEASTVAGGGGEIYTHCNQAEIKMDPSDLAALFPKLRTVTIKNTPNFLGFYNIKCYQVWAASSNKLTRTLSTPLVGSSPDASLMSNNDDELSHVNDIFSSASIELFVPSSDSPVRHFSARDDNQNSDLKEEGIDNSAAAEDVDIDESARCNTEALDHSSTSSSTPLDQGTSSKPTKALVAPLIASSLDLSLALVFVPPLLPVSDSNQESANSSIPNLGKVEFILSSLSEQSVPSSDSPMRKTADNRRKPSDPSSSSSDDDWKGSRVLIQDVYVKAEMRKTFEEILTENPNFLSGLRFKKAEIKTLFVESAICTLQSLGQYTARTMSEEQLTCIKESLDDLVASGLDMGWLERGYKRASLVMKEQKAVLAANELARLDRKKVEAEAAFEMAKAQLEEVVALRDTSKAECDALFQQVEEGKNLFGGGFDQDTSLGHGLLY